MNLKNYFIFCLAAFIILSLSFNISCSRSGSGVNKISIKGSTTILPIALKIAEEYMKDNKISISISASGSGNGINALIEGNCDIAASSRALEKKEITNASAKGKILKEINIAYDMIVPIVHAENNISNITITQLRDIFKGEIKNWSELGLPDGNITVITRDSTSGTYSIWNRQIVMDEHIVNNAIRVASNAAMIYTISTTRSALGYASAGYINSTVKGLKVNNIKPTIENGINGKYPISRKLYLIINEKNTSPNIISFIDFVLSEEGQRIVKEAEFLPL